MKLSILGTRGIPARYGGFETFADELATRLVQHDINVTVYCEKEADTQQPLNYKGVNLVYITSPKAGPLSTILFDLKCLWHARKRYNAVYMLGYGASVFCFIPRLWGTKVWINMDGIEHIRAKWSPLAKLYLSIMEHIAMLTPNLIIADAQSIYDYLKNKYKKLPPCEVIPYGSYVLEDTPDQNIPNEWGLQPNDYYIVVCRLEPENHVLEILEGFKKSQSTKKLIILGNIKVRTDYVEKLLTINDPRIQFIGTVYDQTKLQALRYYSTAYFHGHSVGGTNPSLLEALGCGNAIIAHDNPFNREVAAKAAIYFKTPSDITKIISDIESQKINTLIMKKAGPEIIKNKYTWEQVVDLYLGLLKQVPDK